MISLRDHLTDLYHRAGELTPAAVVEDARPVDSPLHDRFEWDDSIAGESYRKLQAAQMIRSVRLVFVKAEGKRPERATRAFVSTRFDPSEVDGATGIYRPVEEVLADPVSREVLLRECRREWKAFERRYSHLAEFAQIIGRVEVAAA